MCGLSKLRPTLNMLHHMTVLISMGKTRVHAHNGNRTAQRAPFAAINPTHQEGG